MISLLQLQSTVFLNDSIPLRYLRYPLSLCYRRVIDVSSKSCNILILDVILILCVYLESSENKKNNLSNGKPKYVIKTAKNASVVNGNNNENFDNK